MSTATGKRWERRLVRRIEDMNVAAERVRGSGGGVGTRRGDVLVAPVWPADPDNNRTVTDALAADDLYEDQVLLLEVKKRKSGCGGKTLHNTHHEAALDQGATTLRWEQPDGEVYVSGGLSMLKEPPTQIQADAPAGEPLPGSTAEQLDGVQAFALKLSRQPWICIRRL